MYSPPWHMAFPNILHDMTSRAPGQPRRACVKGEEEGCQYLGPSRRELSRGAAGRRAGQPAPETDPSTRLANILAMIVA